MDIDVWAGGRCYALDPMVRLKRKVEERLNRAIEDEGFEGFLELARYDAAQKLGVSVFDSFDEEEVTKCLIERFREVDDET
jgi:hypothetical protein